MCDHVLCVCCVCMHSTYVSCGIYVHCVVCVSECVCGYYLVWFTEVPIEHRLRKKSMQMVKRAQSQGPL